MSWSQNFNKNNFLFALTLGLPYSVILIFSAYGPALHYIIGPQQNALLSSIFLAVLLVSMVLPLPRMISRTAYIKLTAGLIAAASVLLGFFAVLPLYLQIAVIILTGYIEGRIASLWSDMFISDGDRKNCIFVLSAALAASYFLLYLSNLIFPQLSSTAIAVASASILALSIPLLLILSGRSKTDAPNGTAAGSMDVFVKLRRGVILRILILVFIIYITAGFTYTIIFPTLRETVRFYRFYNVLPFVIALPSAGFILHRYGVRVLLHLGISFLGISYVFYHLRIGNSGYFLTESFIQPGWAFLDLLVWFLGVYFAERTGKSIIVTVFVAVFLLGTLSGAVLSLFLEQVSASNSMIFLLLSILPLIIVIPVLNSIRISTGNEKSKKESRLPKKKLTPREYEIALLLTENYTQAEICDKINISINTLKTHTRNIYKKLNLSSKRDIINNYGERRM